MSARLASFALLYGVAQLLGNAFYFDPGSVATMWPASGLLLAALVAARQPWLAVVLVATLVQVAVDVVGYGRPTTLSLIFCTANAVEALVGAILLRRFAGPAPDVVEVLNVVALAAGPALFATAAGAGIGATAVVAWFPAAEFRDVWQTWWLADAVGVIVIAPVAIGWSTGEWSLRAEIAGRNCEGLALVVATLATIWWTFGTAPTTPGSLFSYPYLIYPVLLWVALRFGPWCAATALAAVALLAVAGADQGLGPFRTPDQTLRVQVLAIQAFLFVTSVSILALGASGAQRRKAELATEEEHRILEKLLAGSLQGVVMVDPDLRATYANHAFADMFGFADPAEVVSDAALSELIEPRRLQVHAAATSSAGVGPEVSEFEARRRDGAKLHVLAAVRATTWQGRRVVQAAMVDISARKRGEVELARHRDRLEELVAERTRELELAQENLLRNERLAVLGQLTGTVSHELRNPLGTIHTSIFSLRRMLGGREPRTERILKRIDRSVERCVTIIGELLSYATTTAAELGTVALDPCVARIVGEAELDERIRLELVLESGATVRLDSERFRQILTNVIGNACQAMVDGHEPASRAPELRIETRCAGSRAEILVIDNGPGISSANIDRVFEPLFSTRSFGVGLGLPLVKRLMEEHGGGVELRSRPGEGTRATLWLPSEPVPA